MFYVVLMLALAVAFALRALIALMLETGNKPTRYWLAGACGYIAIGLFVGSFMVPLS